MLPSAYSWQSGLMQVGAESAEGEGEEEGEEY